jgi:hypothetical protein
MQRVRDLVDETNNITLAITAFAFVMALLILMPQVIPGGRFGVSCSSLANPIPGGNNQSLLSTRSEGALQMDISLARSSIAVNDSLSVNVTFVNNGVGAITLFFIPEESLLRDDGTPGLSFEILRLPDRTVYSEPANIRPANVQRQSFAAEVLHILGPKQRCTEQITFSNVRLSNLGLQPGSYALQAVYRNSSRGTLNVSPAATATPIFRDQGVYITSELRSNQVEFTVGAQAAPDEAAPLGG